MKEDELLYLLLSNWKKSGVKSARWVMNSPGPSHDEYKMWQKYRAGPPRSSHYTENELREFGLIGYYIYD